MLIKDVNDHAWSHLSPTCFSLVLLAIQDAYMWILDLCIFLMRFGIPLSQANLYLCHDTIHCFPFPRRIVGYGQRDSSLNLCSHGIRVHIYLSIAYVYIFQEFNSIPYYSHWSYIQCIHKKKEMKIEVICKFVDAKVDEENYHNGYVIVHHHMLVLQIKLKEMQAWVDNL